MEVLNNKSQSNKVLEHLKSGNRITPLEALNMFGCFRLSAIIYHLKDKGHNIQTRLIKRDNKQFAEYRLEEKHEYYLD